MFREREKVFGEIKSVFKKEKGDLTKQVDDLTGELHSSMDTRKKLEALVAQLTQDLERAREVKVRIEDRSGKMGKMLLAPALGLGERS